MFLAEFAFAGTTELADELLIQSSSEGDARSFAETYAEQLGLELFAFALASDQQIRLYSVMRKRVTLTPASTSS